jgi:MFS family permease
MSFVRNAPLDEQTRSNFAHLYLDMVWFGVLAGSAIAFLGIYAARLGANSFQMGLLTAGPGLVNLLFSLPSGSWLEGKPLIRATFRSAIFTRLGYLALVPLPWILADPGQIWGIIWITLLMSIPGTLVAISFNALFAESVPPEWRAHVLGRRNALFAVMVTITSLLCGLILDSVIFPLNYQIVFLIGAAGSMLSAFHVGRIGLPGETPIRIRRSLDKFVHTGSQRLLSSFRHPLAGLIPRDTGKPLLRLDLLRSSFGPFLLAYLMFYTFQYVSLPLFPLYNVINLHLTDGIVSIGTAFFYITMMVMSLGLNRVGTRWSARFMLVSGALFFGFFPLIMFLAKDAVLYLIGNLVGGAIWAVLNAGMINRLMERVPQDDRPAHMALHNIVLNLGILSGSMLGAYLVTWFGLKEVILIGAIVRFAGGLLILVWG